jgi:Trk K+ transport system NAD-binding subunit
VKKLPDGSIVHIGKKGEDITAPNIFKLEKWLYKIDDLSAPLRIFPRGLYIICGYGRMGQKIFEKLDKNNIEVKFIEIDPKRGRQLSKDEKNYVVFGDADDRDFLIQTGIMDAVAVVAVTNDDTTNLSILATAKKLNPDIMTMARENDLADDYLFKSANVNHIFTPSKILVNKVTNALFNPLCDIFIKLIINKDNEWASELVVDLMQDINKNPLIVDVEINFENTPEIYKHLKSNEQLYLKILATSLYNREDKNKFIPLLLQRKNDTMLLPSLDEELKIGDKILIACDEEALSDMEYICENIYEFHYALTGEEKRTIFKGKR